MEERSVKVYGADKTFFSKISTTISKLLIPTQIGLNGMMISMKRNALLKAYEANKNADSINNSKKKDSIARKFEDAFSLYLEAIDKYIMDSIYKKVKNGTATSFEKDALSDYYSIINLKQNEYVEYKNRKQKYLLELDYMTVVNNGKEKTISQFEDLYIEKMDLLYKGILKNYAVKLADSLTTKFEDKSKVYDKIFSTIDDYCGKVLKLKVEKENSSVSQEVAELYSQYDAFSIGKLDEKDVIERNMVLLGVSRVVFTHSVPLTVAEQCYVQLLKQLRAAIVEAEGSIKRNKLYNMLIALIDDYNVKLLSTKVYWDKPELKDEYKAFWEQYKALEPLKEIDSQKYMNEKEALFLKYDIKRLRKSKKNYDNIIKLHKERLVKLGKIRTIKNMCKTLGKQCYSKVQG